MDKQKGVSFIEILISLLLISLLLLGWDAAELASLRAAKSAYYLSVAGQQMTVLAKKLSQHQSDDIETLVSAWNQQNQQVLPQGHGQVSGHFPLFELVLSWGNKIGPSGCLRQIITV